MERLGFWGVAALGFAALLAGREPVLAQDQPHGWVGPIDSQQYFAVLVEDVDRAATWYRTAFGLRELDDTEADDGAWRIVNLSGEQLFVEIIRDKRARSVDRALGFFKVGFRVPDVEVVAARLEREAGERPRIIDDSRHGLRILQLRDPEGNIIQLFSDLGKRKGSDPPRRP